MEAAKFILDVEVFCRAAGVSFILVVNKLFLKDRREYIAPKSEYLDFSLSI